MLTFSDDDFRRQIQEETGIKPEWAAEAFEDLEEDVRQSIARIKASPFIPRKGCGSGLRLRRDDRFAGRGQLRAGSTMRRGHSPVRAPRQAVRRPRVPAQVVQLSR